MVEADLASLQGGGVSLTPHRVSQILVNAKQAVHGTAVQGGSMSSPRSDQV